MFAFLLALWGFICRFYKRSCKFLAVGFPSPWRFARRLYWYREFDRLSFSEQLQADMLGVSPSQLIARGHL